MSRSQCARTSWLCATRARLTTKQGWNSRTTMAQTALKQSGPLLIDGATLRAYMERGAPSAETASPAARGAVYGLVLLLTCADVKSITTASVHWWALVPFLVAVFPALLRARWKLDWSVLFGG